MPPVTNVYVDGFNLYYGCLKGSTLKWLDLARLCSVTFPHNSFNRIRYFTALVQPRPDDPAQAQRQQMYLRALHTIPNLSVHYGHFLPSKIWAPLVDPPPNGSRFVYVHKVEEKGSDVNLATHLLVDAFDRDYDAAIVVSNDSDLAEPISIVRSKFGLPVGVLNPHRYQSKQLLKVASFVRTIRPGNLRASQFPPTLTDVTGMIRKPLAW